MRRKRVYLTKKEKALNPLGFKAFGAARQIRIPRGISALFFTVLFGYNMFVLQIFRHFSHSFVPLRTVYFQPIKAKNKAKFRPRKAYQIELW